MLPGGGDSTDDPNGHGTAMASIVAAGVDNGIGIAGVGYHGVSVMPVKVLDADGLGQDSDDRRGRRVRRRPRRRRHPDVLLQPGPQRALQAAVDYAWSKGAVLVAATGNDGSTTATYPAGAAKVVGVSATTPDDTLWSGSNSGADTFLGAPGVDIATGAGSVTGTSASAAIVAGAAALVKANDPVRLERRRRRAARPHRRPRRHLSDTGNGRVNLARALADDSTTPSCRRVWPATAARSSGRTSRLAVTLSTELCAAPLPERRRLLVRPSSVLQAATSPTRPPRGSLGSTRSASTIRATAPLSRCGPRRQDSPPKV